MSTSHTSTWLVAARARPTFLRRLTGYASVLRSTSALGLSSTTSTPSGRDSAQPPTGASDSLRTYSTATMGPPQRAASSST